MAYHNNECFVKGYDALTDILTPLKPHPAHQLKDIVEKPEVWETLTELHQGQDYIMECLAQHPDKPGNLISQYFFPKPEGDVKDLDGYEKNEKIAFSPIFYPEKVNEVLLQEQSSTIDYVQLGRRFVQSLFGFATGLFELPDLALKLSGSDKNLGQQKADAKNEQSKAENDVKQSEKELQQAKQDLEKAKYDLEQANKKLAQVRKDAAALTPEERALSYQEQLKRIEQERKKFQAVNSKFKKAQSSNTRAKNKVNTFIKINKKVLKKPHAVFSMAQADILLPALRIINIAEPGKLVRVEMAAADYQRGNFPKNYLPLNPAVWVNSSKELRKELNALINVDNKRNVNVNLSNGKKVKLPLEDLMTVNKNLDRVANMLNQAVHVEEMKQLEKITAYLINMGGDENKAQASKNSTQLKSNAISYQVDEIAEALKHDKAAVKKYQQIDEVLRRWERFKVPDEITSKAIKKGSAGLLGALAVFEVMNFRQALSADWSKGRSYLDVTGAVLDMAALQFSMFSAVAEMQAGLPSLQQFAEYQRMVRDTNKLAAITQFGKPFANKATLMTWTARLNFVASVYSGAMAAYDGFYCYKYGDKDAAAGLAISTLGFITLAAETTPTLLASIGRGVILNPLSKLGWVGLLAVFVGYAIYYIFKDKPLEAWFTNCPWGTEAFGSGLDLGSNKYESWKSQPAYAYEALMNLMFAPQVTGRVSKIMSNTEGKNDIGQFNLQLPGHKPGRSTVECELSIKPSLSNKKDYQVISLFSYQGKSNNPVDRFWQAMQIQLNEGNNGLVITFSEHSLYPYFEKLKKDSLDLRLRCRCYPYGKQASLNSRSEDAFVLPVSSRNEKGELETPDLWAEAEISIEIHDFAHWSGGLFHNHE